MVNSRPKVHRHGFNADSSLGDPIFEEIHSDDEYQMSDTPSLANGASELGDDSNETPATPFSTTSSKFPSQLKTRLCPFEGCHKAFNRPARLEEHIRSHNNERLYECRYDNCDKTFLRASHLNHHVKSAHTGVRDYVCDRPGCGKSFVTGSRLRRHIAAHDGQDKHRCTEYPPCRETFRKHSTLQKHITTAHLHMKPFPCNFVDPNTGEKCKMAFDTAGNLRSHESRLHTEDRFTCSECSERLKREALDTGTADKDVPSVTFPTYALLQSHIRTVHPPKCPQCPLVCSTSRELRRHLEVAHGDVSIDSRRLFPCTYDGCDRSFTKKGNLTVHIRTVHEREKRFVCGETDLSASKKVAEWDGIGCKKRYGSKLALEEHIRVTHLGLPNAKAERRERLGLSKKPKESASAMSTLAALTGQGYVEETGRHIPCLYDSCEHRFHRDYDLWVHMTSKHNCSEDEVQGLFMQRALLGDQSGPGGNSLGIYGLEFDNEFFPPPGLKHETIADANQDHTFHSAQPRSDDDFSMQDAFPSAGEDQTAAADSMIPNHDEMALIDPVLAYNLMEN